MTPGFETQSQLKSKLLRLCAACQIKPYEESNVSIIVRRVTKAMSVHLGSQYIQLRSTEEEPRTYCHIAINRPSVTESTDFVNRKGNYTFNC